MWYRRCPACDKRSPVLIDQIGVQRFMCCERVVDTKQASRELKRTGNHLSRSRRGTSQATEQVQTS